MQEFEKCPHCGHEEFDRGMVETVRIYEEDGVLIDDLIASDFYNYEYECTECHRTVSSEELI